MKPYKPSEIRNNRPLAPTRHAVVMPLMEKVHVIVGSEEDIFGECYVQAVNSMGRTVKFNKTAIKYDQ